MDPKRSAQTVILFLVGVVLLWGALAWGLPYLDSLRTGNLMPRSTGAEPLHVSITHARVGDEHSYWGIIDLPTPCHSMAAGVSLSGGIPARATIALTVADPLALCAHVLTPTEFLVSVTAPETPIVSVVLNGTLQQVSIVEE